MDGFFSQLPHKCHLEEVASVGIWHKIYPQVDSRVADGSRGLNHSRLEQGALTQAFTSFKIQAFIKGSIKAWVVGCVTQACLKVPCDLPLSGANREHYGQNREHYMSFYKSPVQPPPFAKRRQKSQKGARSRFLNATSSEGDCVTVTGTNSTLRPKSVSQRCLIRKGLRDRDWYKLNSPTFKTRTFLASSGM